LKLFRRGQKTKINSVALVTELLTKSASRLSLEAKVLFFLHFRFRVFNVDHKDVKENVMYSKFHQSDNISNHRNQPLELTVFFKTGDAIFITFLQNFTLALETLPKTE